MKSKASNTAAQAVDEASGAGVRHRIVASAADLTRQQRAISEYVLDHIQEIPFLSVPELAERTGASEATVVRFCQRIGYSGYSDLKMALVEALRDEMAASTPGTMAPNMADVSRDSLLAVAKLEQQNIERTLESVDRTVFRAAAAALFRADHVYTFGLGISTFLADFATYLFIEHGLRSTRLTTRYTSPREQLVVLRPSDLIIAFSFPPYSKQTLEVLEESKERGIQTVVITDRETAPAASLANNALIVSSHGMTFTNATSSAQVLLNALVVEIASSHRGETVDAISRINRILREQAYLVDEDR